MSVHAEHRADRFALEGSSDYSPGDELPSGGDPGPCWGCGRGDDHDEGCPIDAALRAVPVHYAGPRERTSQPTESDEETK